MPSSTSTPAPFPRSAHDHVSEQRHEPVAPVLAGLQLAPVPDAQRHRAPHRHHDPAALSRAGRRAASGIDRASAETRIRSYGAASGQPSTPGGAARIEAVGTPSGPGSRRPTPPASGTSSTPRTDPCRPGQVRQQRGGPPRAGADVEDPVARAAPRAAAASPRPCAAGSWSARARSGSGRRRRRASGHGGAGTPRVALRGRRRSTGIHGLHSTTRCAGGASAFVDTPATSAQRIRNTAAMTVAPCSSGCVRR